jgi:4-diphosphocytidyl-2-C-methyl-D-erythritol kinase
MTITIKAPAKINWFLEIKGKRSDGFHEIETVMQSVSLFDEITVSDADDLALECNVDLGDPKQNLVYRAAELLRQQHAPDRGAQIRLDKRIPHGAGLGGGSSDAANALNALNRLWDLNLHKNDLRAIVSQVGSDCAFFIEGGTAVCTGRGEQVKPMQDIAGLDLVILYPNEVCPTGKVYAELSRDLTYEPRDCYLFHVLPEQPGSAELAPLIFNRLENAALGVSGNLNRAWTETAHERDVLVRFVSGSGSSLVFLLAEGANPGVLVQALEAKALGRCFAVKTLPRGEVWG